MNVNRKDFLKIFGVGAAAIATTAGGIEETRLEAHEVRPLPDGEKHFRSGLAACMDVQRARLYAQVRIEKNSMRQRYSTFAGWDYATRNATTTNLHNQGRLCAPECFAVQKMGVVFAPTSAPQLRNVFAERYAFQFLVGKKCYYESPLMHKYQVADTPLDISAEALHDISALPLILTPECSFDMEVFGDPLPVHGKLAFWAVIDGLHARGVQ